MVLLRCVGRSFLRLGSKFELYARNLSVDSHKYLQQTAETLRQSDQVISRLKLAETLDRTGEMPALPLLTPIWSKYLNFVKTYFQSPESFSLTPPLMWSLLQEGDALR